MGWLLGMDGLGELAHQHHGPGEWAAEECAWAHGPRRGLGLQRVRRWSPRGRGRDNLNFRRTILRLRGGARVQFCRVHSSNGHKS